MVGAQSLSVVCVPGADVLILCGREDKIAIFVVSREVLEGGVCDQIQGLWFAYLIWVKARSYKNIRGDLFG